MTSPRLLRVVLLKPCNHVRSHYIYYESRTRIFTDSKTSRFTFRKQPQYRAAQCSYLPLTQFYNQTWRAFLKQVFGDWFPVDFGSKRLHNRLVPGVCVNWYKCIPRNKTGNVVLPTEDVFTVHVFFKFLQGKEEVVGVNAVVVISKPWVIGIPTWRKKR